MVDFLRSLFLENVVLLVLLELVAVAVVLAVHRRRMTSGSRLALGLTGLLGLVLLLVQYLVQTDREQIQATVAVMARAIDEGDVLALGTCLDAEFQDRGLGKEAWLADLRQRLQRWRIDEAKVGSFTTRVEGDRAVTAFSARCDWRSGEQAGQPVNSSWKLKFVRRPEGWRLQEVLSAKFGPGGAWDYTTILQY